MSALLAHAKAAAAYAVAYDDEANQAATVPVTQTLRGHARAHRRAAQIMREMVKAECADRGET